MCARVAGLGNRFAALWAASCVSNVGDGVRVAALPLLATTLTRDPGLIAGVTVAVWLPWLVFGLHGGAIVDRADRPTLVRNVQLVRLAVAATLAVLVLNGQASIVLVYAVGLAIGLGEVLVDNALQALVPNTVGDEDLERANGRLSAAELTGNKLIGPPLGGLLFSIGQALPFAVMRPATGPAPRLLSGCAGSCPRGPNPARPAAACCARSAKDCAGCGATGSCASWRSGWPRSTWRARRPSRCSSCWHWRCCR